LKLRARPRALIMVAPLSSRRVAETTDISQA